MTNKILLFILVLVIAGVGIWYVTNRTPSAPTPLPGPIPTTPPPAVDDLIQVTSPLPNAMVSSPLTITGRARGNWYFEASFPVTLKDANGVILAQVPAQAQGEWMTTEFVPFSVTLTFDQPVTATGVLILHNDNPSGLPQNDKELDIPVRFAPPTTTKGQFGVATTLQINGAVRFSDGTELTLLKINDSRCKPGVQCIWQGELIAELRVHTPTGADATVLVGTVNHQAVQLRGYTIRLQSATETTATILVQRS